MEEGQGASLLKSSKQISYGRVLQNEVTVTADPWIQSKVSRVLSPGSTVPCHDHK